MIIHHFTILAKQVCDFVAEKLRTEKRLYERQVFSKQSKSILGLTKLSYTW